jgi:hypothetical protein
MKPIVLAAVAAAIATVAAPSMAATLWQMNGGGCTPTSSTLKNLAYWTVTGGGRVKYFGSSVQPLTFICPVNNVMFNSDHIHLRLHYQDPDGPGSAYRVQATLKSRAKVNGKFDADVCRIASRTAGAWSGSAVHCGFSANQPFDVAANLYWVEVVISRTAATSLTVEFNGVELETPSVD